MYIILLSWYLYIMLGILVLQLLSSTDIPIRHIDDKYWSIGTVLVMITIWPYIVIEALLDLLASKKSKYVSLSDRDRRLLIQCLSHSIKQTRRSLKLSHGFNNNSIEKVLTELEAIKSKLQNSV